MESEKIVIASGYFDPLHIGHIEYLKMAKALGTRLIVIVNSDFQAALKKGKSFMPQEQRLTIIQELKSVDQVFLSIDTDKTVCASIRQIRSHHPDCQMIFAKGGDRFSSEIPEAPVCRQLNISMVDGLGQKIESSSNLIQNARK